MRWHFYCGAHLVLTNCYGNLRVRLNKMFASSLSIACSHASCIECATRKCKTTGTMCYCCCIAQPASCNFIEHQCNKIQISFAQHEFVTDTFVMDTHIVLSCRFVCCKENWNIRRRPIEGDQLKCSDYLIYIKNINIFPKFEVMKYWIENVHFSREHFSLRLEKNFF